MLISTRGRYALRVMIDLAQHNDGNLIVLMDMAERQQISEKYLESIVAVLSKNGFVEAHRGRSGGYRLAKKPEEYSVGAILRAVEGPLVPVACIESGRAECPRAQDCMTLPLWVQLDKLLDGYLAGVSLADLVNGTIPAAAFIQD